MSNYLRAYVPGAMYFFTLVTYQRRHILTTPYSIERLRKSFKYTMEKHPFELNAIVILPDHLHCIWTLPENDINYSLRWKLIKHYFSKGFNGMVNHRKEKRIWQRRYWEHFIRDERDLGNHFNYIYYNPVKHGYVKLPIEWPYSSFKKAISQGFYDANWGEGEIPKDIFKMDKE